MEVKGSHRWFREVEVIHSQREDCICVSCVQDRAS
jgi:hypothetical protein